MNGAVVTVSQLNKYVRSLLEGDGNLRSVIVSGEISNLKVNSYSGHMYLTLKDDNAAVKAVMFKSSAVRLKFLPQEGMKVICRGSVTVYERDGAYQLYINDMQPDGAGSIALAFEQLKAKLSAEGLFDASQKQKLPRFPSKLAIITSDTGAAVHDMMSVLGRRWPMCSLVMCPVAVQGEHAVPQMIEAMTLVQEKTDCDLIIIGRGGGSAEDLWCFNDERLARAVFDCKIPVISAVGHETDFTICDLVADMRAPTPSAAAELAVPEISEIYSFFSAADMALEASVNAVINNLSVRLDNLTGRSVFTKKYGFIEPLSLRLDSINSKLDGVFTSKFSKFETGYIGLTSKLDALSPVKTLLRGFSIAEKGGRPVKTVNELSVGDRIMIKLSDGSADCTVNSISPEGEGQNEREI